MVSVEFDGYTVRKATVEDVSGFLNLHRTVFGTWPASKARDVFEWKYVANPYFDDVPVIVAEKDGELVGAKGHFGVEMVAGEEQVLGVQTGDLMVHPDHRRRGLHTKMVELDTTLYDEGEQLFFGFPSEVAAKAYLDSGRKKVENPLYVRPLSSSPPEDGSGAKRTLQRLTVAGYGAYLSVLDVLHPPASGFAVESHDDPPVEVLEALYERHVPGGIHTRRSSEFYSWRLEDPLHEYTTYVARSGNDVVASVVVSERGRRVFVRDVLPFDADAAPVRAILDAVVADFADRESLSAWCPDSLDPSPFRRSGLRTSAPFSGSAYSTTLVVRRRDGAWNLGGLRVDRPENWEIQLLERDY